MSLSQGSYCTRWLVGADRDIVGLSCHEHHMLQNALSACLLPCRSAFCSISFRCDNLLLLRWGNSIILKESNLEVTLFPMRLPFQRPPSLALYFSTSQCPWSDILHLHTSSSSRTCYLLQAVFQDSCFVRCFYFLVPFSYWGTVSLSCDSMSK